MDSKHEQQQLHRNEQNSADLSQADATKQNYGDGADVIGHPVNPLQDPAGHSSPTSAASAQPPSAGPHAPSIPPTDESQAPYNVPRAGPSPSGNFPTAQMPQALSTPATNQSGASQSPTASAPPYVQTSSAPGATGKSTPMDSIMQVFNKWGKMAEDMTGNVWNHLRTGPNVADTAFGRLQLGTRAMTEGGLENVYRQTFEVDPEEHLLKTYACYLSTSTGPVAGTLYISSHKLAFCSDRPLALPADNNNMTNPPAPGATTATSPSVTSPTSKKSSAHQQKQHQQQQQQHSYYKVMVPIPHVESVNPSENTEKKPPEKYVQLKTTDGHEFWFMGFVNYDKGVKNLQETLLSKTSSPNTNTNTNTNAASHDTNNASYDTNAASHDTNNASYDTNTASHVVN